jgi:hypothetical protein
MFSIKIFVWLIHQLQGPSLELPARNEEAIY